MSQNNWQSNADYLYGIDLFNLGYWWEAHEAWERVWMAGKHAGEARSFLQGLIQYSACVLKIYQGTRRGFAGLARAAITRLREVEGAQGDTPFYFGIELGKWLAHAEAFVAKIEKQDYDPPQGDPLRDPAYPFIQVIF